MHPQEDLRRHLVPLLEGRSFHLNSDRILSGIPFPLLGRRVEGVPYTLWQLVCHVHTCLWDLLEFSRTPGHVSPSFPDGLWPEETAPPDEAAWEERREAFRQDLKALREFTLDPQVDLFAPVPNDKEKTVLRSILLALTHTAHHLGQIILMRRLLGAWPPPGK